jgi:hypothetical protein
MQYIVVISSFCRRFCCVLSKILSSGSRRRFKTSFLFLKVCLLVSALSFFSLFFALFLIICVVVCVSFLSFFALSCVVRSYVRNCQLKRAHASSRRRERYHSVTNLGRKRQKSVVPSERKATKQRETPRYCVQRRRRRA